MRSGFAETFFVDVPIDDWNCRHVHYLWAKGMISGCEPANHLYCRARGLPTRWRSSSPTGSASSCTDPLLPGVRAEGGKSAPGVGST